MTMKMIDRRTFLHTSCLGIYSASFSLDHLISSLFSDSIHREIFQQKIDLAKTLRLSAYPFPEIIVVIGESFVGTDYLSHSLESEGDEELRICLTGFDCVTFCESVLAIAHCIKSENYSYEYFKAMLQRIRYEGGIIDGYPSRLHYFSDWIYENENRDFVREITREIGGILLKKKIDFMTMNRSSYPKLSDQQIFSRIKKREEIINNREHYYLPKGILVGKERKIESGDLIAITTSVKGLDISHTGIAVWKEKLLKLLHAPQDGEQVKITRDSISDYLQKNKRHTGIRVVRPVTPA